MKSMLEYQKYILKKVSFDKLLFSKELNKTLKWIKVEEINILYKWVKENFGEKYNDIIISSFKVQPSLIKIESGKRK